MAGQSGVILWESAVGNGIVMESGFPNSFLEIEPNFHLFLFYSIKYLSFILICKALFENVEFLVIINSYLGTYL